MPVPRAAARNAPLVLAGAAALGLTTASATVSYLIRTLTALAAITLLHRAPRLDARTRRLFAAALWAGIASGLVATLHVVVTGSASPSGGTADWVYLAYGPFAVAGLLSLPRRPVEGPWLLVAAVDTAVAWSALALALVPVVRTLVSTTDQPVLTRAAVLGYPAGAVAVVTVLLAVLPRVTSPLLPFLRVTGLGLLLLTSSDIGYGLYALQGRYTPTSWPAVLAEAGLLVVAAGAWTARHPAPDVPAVPTHHLESAAPYAALLPVLAVVAVQWARGQELSGVQLPALLALGAAVVVRQLLASAEQHRTIVRLFLGERDASAAARRDPLTGLGNRLALQDVLTRLLDQADPVPVTLVLLDLDDFKVINDTHGHDTGDEVLREVAQRLLARAPHGAMVVRLGGDEFAVCVRSSMPPRLLGDTLATAFDVPVRLGSRSFRVRASVGVVQADAGAEATPALTMSHADVAMYEAKASGASGSTVVALAGGARDAAAARVRMREEISHPDLSQFRVVYEPVVDLTTGRLAGAEALLRWEHPVLGAVGPSVFVPLAEQVGAINALGELALRTALNDLACWLRQAELAGDPLDGPGDRAAVGVNLSPRQLADPGLVDLVTQALQAAGLPAHRLVLEITEEALLEDWELAVQTIAELRLLGVAVAVDDFGTGYSSLRYLRRFQASTLKVDREFVQALADEPRTRKLVSSVLEMARSLGLYVVAEGVETVEQLAVLQEEGCEFAQGYLFDRPMEREVFGTLLLARHTYSLPARQRRVRRAVPLPRPSGVRRVPDKV